MTLVCIEPGEFLMGTTKKQVDQLMRQFPGSERELFDDEQPQCAVTNTQPLFLSACPVTQGQYQAVMESNPSHFKGEDERPVESVSWFCAAEFCNKLSEREKLKPYYGINGTEVTISGGSGYRLPTEAEWEYACRAGTLTLYPFGDESGQLGEYAWYANNARDSTHPIGQKLPNSWGFYDMLGNVWEWCAERYDANYYGSSPLPDLLGATSVEPRVLRGGCWGSEPRYCRSSTRLRCVPTFRFNDLGFRVARGQG
jgi:formylglycine-generating enzyme required for sulfatase activity